LGPRVLQYVPRLIIKIQSPSSPLVRQLVRFLQNYTKTLTVESCEKLFSTNTIISLTEHNDPTVRCIAIQILGKKCSLNYHYLIPLMHLWTDKSPKVKKEIMDILGDFGKTHKQHISDIMESSILKEVNSVILWRNLSLAWQCLVVKGKEKERRRGEEMGGEKEETDSGSLTPT